MDGLLAGAKSPIALRLRQAVIPPPKFRPGIAAISGSDFPFLKGDEMSKRVGSGSLGFFKLITGTQ